MKKLIAIITTIATLSILLNVYVIMHDGIKITNTYNQQQYQNQAQAQVTMNWWAYQGEFCPVVKYLTKEELSTLMTTINPIEFSLLKVTYNSTINLYTVVYPEMKIDWRKK